MYDIYYPGLLCSDVVLKQLQQHNSASDDIPASTPRNAELAVETRTQRALTIALQSILLESPSRLPANVFTDEYTTRRRVDGGIRKAMDVAGRQVQRYPDVWKNLGEEKAA